MSHSYDCRSRLSDDSGSLIGFAPPSISKKHFPAAIEVSIACSVAFKSHASLPKIVDNVLQVAH